jgi:hypothetical protein
MKVILKICGELIQYEWRDGALLRLSDREPAVTILATKGKWYAPMDQLASTGPRRAGAAGNAVELR